MKLSSSLNEFCARMMPLGKAMIAWRHMSSFARFSKATLPQVRHQHCNPFVCSLLTSIFGPDELRITAMLSDSEPGSFLYRSTIEAVPRSSGGENCVTFLNQLYVACRLNAGRDLQSFLTFLIEQGMEAEVRTSWPSNLQRASPSTQLSSLIVRPLEFETSLTTLAYGSSLRDQIQAHTIQHGELTVLNIALAQKNETLEEKCFVLVAETESLQMTLDETRQNYALLEGDMALLLKANTQLRDEERNLNEQIAKLKTDLATTHSSLERANKEKTTSERKLILLHGRAQRAVSQRDAAVAQRATLQAQLERARNSCAKVSQELQETDGDDLFV